MNPVLVCFSYPELPPSSNRIYFTRPGGGRGLSTDAKAYKTRFIWALARAQVALPAAPPSTTYALQLYLLIHNLRTKSKTAKHPFRQLDADNRIKLVQDALTEGLGIDDRAVWSVNSSKIEIPAEEPERIVAAIRLFSEEQAIDELRMMEHTHGSR